MKKTDWKSEGFSDSFNKPWDSDAYQRCCWRLPRALQSASLHSEPPPSGRRASTFYVGPENSLSTEFKELLKIFTVLRDHEEETGYDYGLKKLDQVFFDEAIAGTFTERSPMDQIRRIGGLFDMYLGRGQAIMPAIVDGRITREYPKKLKTAAFRYYLTLSLSDEMQASYREALSRLSEEST